MLELTRYSLYGDPLSWQGNIRESLDGQWVKYSNVQDIFHKLALNMRARERIDGIWLNYEEVCDAMDRLEGVQDAPVWRNSDKPSNDGQLVLDFTAHESYRFTTADDYVLCTRVYDRETYSRRGQGEVS